MLNLVILCVFGIGFGFWISLSRGYCLFGIGGVAEFGGSGGFAFSSCG